MGWYPKSKSDNTPKYSWVFTLKPIKTRLSNIHGLGPYNPKVTNFCGFRETQRARESQEWNKRARESRRQARESCKRPESARDGMRAPERAKKGHREPDARFHPRIFLRFLNKGFSWGFYKGWGRRGPSIGCQKGAKSIFPSEYHILVTIMPLFHIKSFFNVQIE